jgi:serine/threonine protein kinase
MSEGFQYAPFEKIKLLGEGSYGKAYLVRQLADNSLAVLKQIDLTKMSVLQD